MIRRHRSECVPFEHPTPADWRPLDVVQLDLPPAVAYGRGMTAQPTTLATSAGPSHVPSGAALLALELSEIARGIRGLDVLRRSVDRAPPAWS